MTTRELMEKTAGHGGRALLASPDHLLTRIQAEPVPGRHQRSVSLRRSFVLGVALAALFSIMAVTAGACALGWIEFPGLYRVLGVDQNQMEPEAPQYGIIQRVFAGTLREWNGQRLARGLDQGDVSRITSALAAGDLTLPEVYALYGKPSLSQEQIDQVLRQFPELPDLEAEVREGAPQRDALYPRYKQGDLTPEELAWWEGYTQASDRMYQLQEEAARQLQALQDSLDDPSLWTLQIPEPYRMSGEGVPRIADVRLESDAAYLQDLVQQHLPELLAVEGAITSLSPAPEDVAAAWERLHAQVRETRYPDGLHPADFPYYPDSDSWRTVPQEAVAEFLRPLFPPDVELIHGTPVDETEALEMVYDAEAGAYRWRFLGTEEPPAQWQVFPLSITRRGDARVMVFTVLKMEDDGETRTLSTPDGVLIRTLPSRQLITLDRYELGKVLDQLPKWEPVPVDPGPFPGSGPCGRPIFGVRRLHRTHRHGDPPMALRRFGQTPISPGRERRFPRGMRRRRPAGPVRRPGYGDLRPPSA